MAQKELLVGRGLKLEFQGKSKDLTSKIGFGTWGLGGDAYGEIEADKAIELVRYAYLNGIRIFDTSPLYGGGKCEEILGKALRIYPRDSFKIITKAGLYKVAGVEMRNFEDQFLLESLKQSMRRLNVSSIDYFMLHSPTHSELDLGMQTSFGLKEVIQDRLVKNFGVSIKSPNDLQAIEKIDSAGVVEFNFSLMDQRFYHSIKASDSNYFRIARTPYNFGFLTETPPSKAPPNSANHHLSNWRQSQFDNWHNFRMVWHGIAEENGLTIQDLALSFILSEPRIDLVIPGFMEFEHIDQAISSARNGVLTQFCMKQIKEVYSAEEPKFRIEK